MADDQDSKTEKPTSKRLEKAREEGNILQSTEVKTAASLLGILVVVWMIVPSMMQNMRIYMAGLLQDSGQIRVGSEVEARTLLVEVGMQVGLFLALPLAVMLLLGVSATVVQTGFAFSSKRIKPDLKKLNPLSGLKRMFSMNNLVEFIKNLAKMSVVGIICYLSLKPKLKELEHLAGLDMTLTLKYTHDVIVDLMISVVIFVVALAAADYFYQRYSYIKRLKMTKQEVKDEHKQSEGDPMIKSRLRSLRVQRSRQRMMAAVPKADVVVTNPTHFACALKYDGETMNAPVLVAKGQDLVALRIRQVAEENEVPIVENPPLARALFASVDLDREIPAEHYKAVAEVISYVMRFKGKRRK